MTPAIAHAAVARGYAPATVAAIVAVESRGAGLRDGRPVILFEPHVAHRVARPAVRALLRARGVGARKWGEMPYPAGQAAQWTRFDTAARLAGRDVAVQACSWGLGQVLGENWRLCGYASPAAFEAAQATEAGQIETMLRYLDGAGLAGAIAARDWRAIARAYNGPGQVDRYAARMEAEYRKLTGEASPVVLRQGDSGPAVRALQRALGEREDGRFGPRTAALVRDFQRAEGIVADGVVGAVTWARLQQTGAAATPPPAQPTPTPAADWTATAGKITAGAAAVTAAAKGLAEATDATAGLVAGIDPTLVALAVVAGLALVGAAFVLRRARA